MRPLLLVLLSSSWLLADDNPHAKNTQKEGEHPPTAKEQMDLMMVPQGFEILLFASEPEIRQPVAFTFDDRGRLWVLECYTYTGKKEYDEEKRDRIVILEDKDGDGVHDTRKVFWDEGMRAFGIEWGHGGVWITQAPYLSFIPDRNQDDVPDGPVEHKLDGFTTKASHNNVNGLRWGPDGWLWGRHGMLASSKAGVVDGPPEERREFKASIWRYHPAWDEFEIVCTGGVNPWGFDWNEEGQMFFTNNVNGQLFHLLPGARYRENFIPPHDADRQPFLNQCADHQHFEYGKAWHQARLGATTDELGGGHSHCGGMIYLGDNWPKEYRGRVFTNNVHGKRINVEMLERKGSGYVAKHGPDFLMANNPWFRGVELKYGPDGGVYVLDWSDYGECHDHDGVHRTSGRIYKVTYGKVRPRVGLNLQEFDDLELLELQLFDNEWWVRRSRRILQERSQAGTLDREAVKRDLLELFRHPKVSRRLRAMWCLFSADLIDRDWLQVQMRDPDEHVRSWALRLLADRGLGYGRVKLDFLKMARNEPSALMRVTLASAMQKVPIGRRLEVLVPLAQREEDIDDPNIALMIWFAAEESIDRTPDLAVELATTTVHRLTRRFVARKIAANRLRKPDALAELIQELKADDTERLEDLLEGLLDALGGARKVVVPPTWKETYVRLGSHASSRVRQQLAELAVVFSDEETMNAFRAKAADDSVAVEERARALEVLVKAGADDLEELLVTGLETKGMEGPALRGLGATPGVESANRILKKLPSLDAVLRTTAISSLVSRIESAEVLLAAVEAGSIKATTLSAFHARQIQSLGNKKLNASLKKLWGSVRATDAEKKREMARLRGVVKGQKGGDRQRGKELYLQRCAGCHVLWGEGGHAGPDLTGSNRKNLDYLLENIVDPSASVPRNYRYTVVELKDGQTLGGFVEEDLGSLLRLRSDERVISLSRDRIKRRKDQNTSLMPEALLTGMSDAEVRDLFAYLRGERPVKGGEGN